MPGPQDWGSIRHISPSLLAPPPPPRLPEKVTAFQNPRPLTQPWRQPCSQAGRCPKNVGIGQRSSTGLGGSPSCVPHPLSRQGPAMPRVSAPSLSVPHGPEVHTEAVLTGAPSWEWEPEPRSSSCQRGTFCTQGIRPRQGPVTCAQGLAGPESWFSPGTLALVQSQPS